MAFTGKLETEEEIKSSAEKFWGAIKDNTDLLGKIFPEVFKSIQVAEGDGKSVGSIRHIKYAEGETTKKHSVFLNKDPHTSIFYQKKKKKSFNGEVISLI